MTAILVCRQFGGEIVRGVLAPTPEALGFSTHYWNRLPDLGEVDLTRTQFQAAPAILETATRDAATLLTHPDTARRTALLAERLGLPALRDPIS